MSKNENDFTFMEECGCTYDRQCNKHYEEACLNHPTVKLLHEKWCRDSLIADAVREWANQETQRRSFVFGNCNLDNPNVTKEVVDKAADEKLGLMLAKLYHLAK